MNYISSQIKYMRKSLLSRLTSSFRSSNADDLSMSTLETLHFDNLALRRLPLDPIAENYVRTVNGACFSRIKPTAVKNPSLVACSEDAMSLLDLVADESKKHSFVEYFSGNKLLPGSEPAAHCYCGHQFGYFSGQLGDGAALYLGEVINSKGERWEIQLKGAGKTPYSRTADGRKVMRSSIREFLCSEAMHFLGIPTTRAGACITSDTKVIRDIFYDGHPKEEKCTVVLRIAPTFIRFGSFEIFKTMDPVTRHVGPSVGRVDMLKQLLDYIIETFYPQLVVNETIGDEERYASFFKEVLLSTAQLVAHWQCVGFCHGVLNTDNMSILGLTMDYGPFGFMDMYNPDYICNSSDDGGRYTYSQQPSICLWNLKKLSEAIEKAVPLSLTTPMLDLFNTEFDRCYMTEMRKKLGLLKDLPTDNDLVEKLFSTMGETGADFTNTFRCMSLLDLPGLNTHDSALSSLREKLSQQCYPTAALLKSLKDGINSRNIQMLLMLSSQNPAFANLLDSSGTKLNKILAKMEKAEKIEEMSEKEKKEHDAAMWNDWLLMYVDRLKKETENITDENKLKEIQAERCRVMNATNPRFILRNYIAQEAIDKAEKGDFAEVSKVLKLLEKPFDSSAQIENLNIGASTSKAVDDSSQGSRSEKSTCLRTEGLPPEWAYNLRVT